VGNIAALGIVNCGPYAQRWEIKIVGMEKDGHRGNRQVSLRVKEVYFEKMILTKRRGRTAFKLQ